MRLQNELISKIIITVQDYTIFKVISNLKLGNVNNILVELFVSKILNFHKNAELSDGLTENVFFHHLYTCNCCNIFCHIFSGKSHHLLKKL